MQAPPVERYLHDLLQYALGVLHIITLVPHSRKMIVNVTLSNDRVGIAVILDAANVTSSYVDPEVESIFLSSVVHTSHLMFESFLGNLLSYAPLISSDCDSYPLCR